MSIDTRGPNVVIDGERWYKFFADYEYDGRKYCFDFYARTEEEASEMLRAIRRTAVECYQVCGEVSATPLAGLWVRLACWWKNLWAR